MNKEQRKKHQLEFMTGIDEATKLMQSRISELEKKNEELKEAYYSVVLSNTRTHLNNIRSKSFIDEPAKALEKARKEGYDAGIMCERILSKSKIYELTKNLEALVSEMETDQHLSSYKRQLLKRANAALNSKGGKEQEEGN